MRRTRLGFLERDQALRWIAERLQRVKVFVQRKTAGKKFVQSAHGEARQFTGLHFHDLRGSGATWAATGGATIAELMARLGHTRPTMALRYQHATQERDAAIAERLGALLRAADAAPESDVPEVANLDR